MFGVDLSPQNHINKAIREKSAHPSKHMEYQKLFLLDFDSRWQILVFGFV